MTPSNKVTIESQARWVWRFAAPHRADRASKVRLIFEKRQKRKPLPRSKPSPSKNERAIGPKSRKNEPAGAKVTNPELPGDFAEEKLAFLDVAVILDNGSRVDIEMQPTA